MKGIRFFDQADTKLVVQNIEESMTAQQKAYLAISKAFSSNTRTTVIDSSAYTVLFQDLTLATPPPGFPPLSNTDFTFYINGLVVETDAITSIQQVGNDVLVTLNPTLNFTISSEDEFLITGKFA